jgi:hypothetical protein
MRKEYQDELDGFLREGDEDYIGFWEIKSAVSSLLNLPNTNSLSKSDSEKLLKGVLEFVQIMLRNGFMVGRPNDRAECDAWPDQNPAHVAKKIEQEWVRLKGDAFDTNFIAYFFKINPEKKKKRKA